MRVLRAVVVSALLCLIPSLAYAQGKVKFPFAASSKTLGISPLWAALKQGIFEQQGLEVQLILVRGTPLSVQALAAGSVYIAGPTSDGVIEATGRGLDLVIVGGVVNGLTHAVVGGKKYKSYEDLRGATIGSLSLTSGITFALRRVLKAKGLEYPRDYKLINVGGSPELFAALSAGQIAAAPLAFPINLAAEESGLNLIGWYREVLPNYQAIVLVVSRSWAEENRPLLVRFLKAMVLTNRWLYDHKEAAVDFLAKEMKLKPAYARKGWEYYTENRLWPPDADINLEGLKTVIQIYGEQTQIKGALPNAAQYVDQSYLKEALKELGAR